MATFTNPDVLKTIAPGRLVAFLSPWRGQGFALVTPAPLLAGPSAPHCVSRRWLEQQSSQPPLRQPGLQRNLLYTGVTRGKKLVVLVGQKKAVAIAVRNVSGRRRWSKLQEWLTKNQ